MSVSRRDFLGYCAACAGVLGLDALGLTRLEAALAANGAPTIIWLHGSGCQGDSVSFLNRIDGSAPAGQQTVDDILVNTVNLAYHTVVMSSAGEQAVAALLQAKRAGGYVLVLEGAVPRAFGGRACTVWTHNGVETTYQEAIADLAAGAAAVVCVGTCASFGGIAHAGSNDTDVITGGEAAGRPVINIPGCPAHPDWIAWAVVQLVLGNPVELDSFNRPTALYGEEVHANCPRRLGAPTHVGFATTFGQDHLCLLNLGCRGPMAFADCPSRKRNNGVNWCVDANAMCFACVQPDFPGGSFYTDPAAAAAVDGVSAATPTAPAA